MNIFIDSEHRLRSGWRFVIFWLTSFLIGGLMFGALTLAVKLALPTYHADQLLDGRAAFLIQGVIIFAAAFIAGWACSRILEWLPVASLGWALHRGWWRDLVIGFALGGLTVGFAALIAGTRGGMRFELNQDWQSVSFTLLTSGFVFLIAAAGEEALFRGYGLQTMARANLAWVGIAVISVWFAFGHLNNPNVSPRFTLINTILAGVWLSVAYLKTRSLWFALGVHWSWNWIMGAFFGIPVSGITKLTPAPLMHFNYGGPDWLSGGGYGLEGGLACTIAVVLSTLVIWRMPFVRPTEEMLAANRPAKTDVNVETVPQPAAPPASIMES